MIFTHVLFQKPEGGSTTSLQDSGISEHEGGATGGHSGPSSPLSKLPGNVMMNYYSLTSEILDELIYKSKH